jgi:8-oxo-dGTP pyrophosphatase MutT (NUDIX family)
MDLQTLITRFQFQLPQPSAMNQNLTESAVLLPFQQGNNELELIFTRRPEHVKHHPSQICFPGGKREETDLDLKQTAIRETVEELGVRETDIKLIGELPALLTRTGFYVKPFLAELSATELAPDPFEVAEVLTLPARPLLKRRNYHEQTINIQSEKQTVYGIKTQHGFIWGVTAHIMVNLIGQLKIYS